MLKIEITYTEGNRTYGICPAIPQSLVTEGNQKAWAEYLHRKIRGLINRDVLESKEFLTIQQVQIADRKIQEQRALENRLREEKNREDYYRRKVMERPKIAFIPKGLTVDYEKEYARFFEQEVEYEPVDSDDFLYQCIISAFESTYMCLSDSIERRMEMRSYNIEIQCLSKSWEWFVTCSQFLILPALNSENPDENTHANFRSLILPEDRNFDIRAQQLGSNRRGLQLKMWMTSRLRNDISMGQALWVGARFCGSSSCPKASMTFASNQEATLKVA